MLYKRYRARRWHSSQNLTFAVIGVVVSVNAVGWGIPLALGERHASGMPAAAGIAPLAARVTSRDGERLVITAAVPVPVRLVRWHPPPLPAPGPARAAPPRQAVVLPVSAQPAAPSPVGRPATLYPRFEAAPAQLIEPKPSLPRKRPAPVSGTEAAEIVLVSPYTPGVRIMPTETGRGWRHRNRYAPVYSAAIGERPEPLPESSKGNGGRRARLGGQDAAPVAAMIARPPRIVGGGGRSIAKSASNAPRPRLVRPPLHDPSLTVSSPGRFSPPVALADQRRTTVLGNDTPAPPVLPTLMTRLTAAENRESDAVVSDATTPIARARVTEAPTGRQAALARLRATRAVRTRRRVVRRQPRANRMRHVRRHQTAHNRHAARRINGFRPRFHRQLVSANFFSTGH